MYPKNQLSDEELLLASRMGDYKAEAMLAERMFEGRYFHCRYAAEEASHILDDWSLNEAYLKAFLASVDGYRFGANRFITYFRRALRNEIIRMATRKIQEQTLGGKAISLDAPASEEVEPGAYSLCDFVPSGDFMDDPRAFLNYAERLEELHRLPKNADPMMLDVVRLTAANYTIADTAKICGLSVNRVKYLLHFYRQWAIRSKKLIASHGGKRKAPKRELDFVSED